MSDMFSVIAKLEDDDSHKRNTGRAAIASVSRVQQKFAKFVGSSSDAEERIELIQSDILATVKEACAEHGLTEHADIQTALDAAMSSLRQAANPVEVANSVVNYERPRDTTCPDCGAPVDVSTMECPVCGGGAGEILDPPHPGEVDGDIDAATRKYHEDRKKQLYEAVGSKTADADGDTYTQSTESLPTSTADGSTTGLGGEFIENGTATSADVPSKANPSEMQGIAPDNADTLKQDPDLVSETGKQVDVDSPIGEEQVGDRTDTFPTPEGQGSAVTSRWRVEV